MLLPFPVCRVNPILSAPSVIGSKTEMLELRIVGTLFFERPCVKVAVDKNATFYGRFHGFFTAFRVDNGEVVRVGFGEGSGNIRLFKTVA